MPATNRAGASVWSEVSSIPPLALLDLDSDFALGSAVAKPTVNAASEGVKLKKGWSLLKPARSQNVGIMLARFRMPPEAIRVAVVQMDDRELSIENLKAIKQNAPTTDEASNSIDSSIMRVLTLSSRRWS